MERVFDKARARDVYESIYILYGLQVLAMWALIGVCIYLSAGRSVYWLPSIFSSMLGNLAGNTALSYYLCRNVSAMDQSTDSERAFLKKMRCQDILSIASAIVCTIAFLTAGWLGFTYGENPLESTEYLNTENKSEKQLEEEEKHKDNNGQMSGALLGVNLLGPIMCVMCLWADRRFRQYLRSQGKLISPEEYEAQVVREGQYGTTGML